MKFKEQFTKRLNLNVSPETYEIIEQIGINQGRKVGNLVRIVLDQWAEGQMGQVNDMEEIV